MIEPSRHAPALALVGLFFAFGCAPEPETPRLDTPRIGHAREPVTAVTREWFVTQLIADDDTPLNAFGADVAISGTTVVVGAPVIAAPAAYVFVLEDDGWHQQAKLLPPADFENHDFGRAVAVSGDTVIVGAPEWLGSPDIKGAAYVYVRSGTSFSPPVTLAADDGVTGDLFGSAVAISGDTAVVGAMYASIGNPDDGFGSEGAAYLFTRSGTTFTQTRKLSASDGQPTAQFGDAVAISGTDVLIAASHWPQDYGGAVYAYSTTDTTERKLRPADIRSGDEFGHSVAISGNIAVVGAYAHWGRDPGNGGYRAGAAFVFTKTASDWMQQTDTLFADDGGELDAFGAAVTVSGDIVMVGAPGFGGTDFGGSDTVYLFSPPSALIQSRIGSRGEVPFFGGTLELDGDIAAVGSLFGRNGGYVAELLAVDGSACDSNLDCRTRFCVDGVCCNKSCSGACEECGSGECTPLPLSPEPACAPYLCGEDGGGCPMTCTANSQCLDSHYCKNHQCAERVQNGGSCGEVRACLSGRCIDGKCAGADDIGVRCSRSSDCGSGFCRDGYCCDQRCDGQCEACDVRGAHGVCSAVTGAPHGDRDACESDGTPCGGDCDGEHTVACSYKTSDTPCGSSCDEGTLTESTCNGQGACEEGTPRSCENLRCADAETCKTSCANSDDCLSGFTCQDGRCEAGSTCSDDHTSQAPDGATKECSPYFCRDGSCEDSCEDTKNDCTPGYVCNDRHQCGTRPPKQGVSRDSGGCSVGRSGSSERAPEALGLAALAGLFALVRRRKARARVCRGAA